MRRARCRSVATPFRTAPSLCGGCVSVETRADALPSTSGYRSLASLFISDTRSSRPRGSSRGIVYHMCSTGGEVWLDPVPVADDRLVFENCFQDVLRFQAECPRAISPCCGGNVPSSLSHSRRRKLVVTRAVNVSSCADVVARSLVLSRTRGSNMFRVVQTG